VREEVSLCGSTAREPGTMVCGHMNGKKEERQSWWKNKDSVPYGGYYPARNFQEERSLAARTETGPRRGQENLILRQASLGNTKTESDAEAYQGLEGVESERNTQKNTDFIETFIPSCQGTTRPLAITEIRQENGCVSG